MASQRDAAAGPSSPRPRRSPGVIVAGVVLVVVVVALVMGVFASLHRGSSTLAKDGSGLSLHDQVLQFTVPPADDSTETDFQSSLRDSALNQVDELSTRGVDTGKFTDPMAGAWQGTSGYIVFSSGQFSWYDTQDHATPTGPYRQGSYMWMPGCQVNGQFSMDWHGGPCYLIMLRYATVTQGQSDNVTRYGAFWVARAADGSLDVMNERTSDEYQLTSA